MKPRAFILTMAALALFLACNRSPRQVITLPEEPPAQGDILQVIYCSPDSLDLGYYHPIQP